MLGHYYSSQYLNQIKFETRTKLHLVEFQNFVLPLFEYTIDEKYSCFNSSPYFCSHGGFSADIKNISNIQYDSYYKIKAIYELKNIINPKVTLSFTTVSNPYSSKEEEMRNNELLIFLQEFLNFKYFSDQKISTVMTSIDGSKNEILGMMHSKHRNAIRKFLKLGHVVEKVTFENPLWQNYVNELIEYNKLIAVKGGVPKSSEYFQNLKKYYDSQQCFIYRVTDSSNAMLASCLFFKFEETLEYWTPIISEKGRPCNALQGLLFEVMHKEAVSVSHINFGGTNPLNTNLRRFKERFGAQTRDYFLHNFVNLRLLDNYDLKSLMKAAPYFYFWREQCAL